eukprot:3377598-Alexandrium_andersonii.AAC.1
MPPREQGDEQPPWLRLRSEGRWRDGPARTCPPRRPARGRRSSGAAGTPRHGARCHRPDA